MNTEAFYTEHVCKDDIWLFNTGKARRAYLSFGCHFLPEINMHRFMLWAPNAVSVCIVGDFNGWDKNANPMQKRPDGVWLGFVSGAKNGDIYKYCVVCQNGTEVLKADPFAFHAETGPATGSKIWDITGFSWDDEEYMLSRPKRDILKSPVSIYEMHLGSWRVADDEVFPNYKKLAEPVADYCTMMGYTHVELLPVTEYPFEGSWGYQVTGYFAPTSRYGTPQDFMYFVSHLHKAGIGVILDWVPAHFPKDEHGLRLFDGTALYELSEKRMAEHPEWGTLIFDYEKPQVKSFLISSAMFFFDFYHIDGIRVDAVSSMLYLDYGRKDGQWTKNSQGGNINLGAVDFLRLLNKTVLSAYPGAITAAEEATAFPLVTRPPEHGGLGFMFKWDMGFMHDTLKYMALDPYFRSKNHDKLTFSMVYAFSENYILPFSHDEVVHGKMSMLSKMWGNYDTQFSSLRLLFAYTFSHPGKKLMFMGSEFGQFIEWDNKKELDWFLLKYPRHSEMQSFVKKLNEIYKDSEALWGADCSWDGFLWLNVDDAQRSSVAFMRCYEDKQMVCAFNFTPVKYENFVIGLPEKGILTEILNSDSAIYGGTGVCNKAPIVSDFNPFLNHKYSAKITLPPMAAVWFNYDLDPELELQNDSNSVFVTHKEVPNEARI